MIKIKLLIFSTIVLLLFLIGISKAFAQYKGSFYNNYNLDSNKIGLLYLDIDDINFFKNNEFLGEKISGYTLPGFILKPKLSLQLSKKINIEAGFNLLHFWGADKYPSSYYYSTIAEWETKNYQDVFHVNLIFTAQIELAKNLHLVLGSFHKNNNHNLITPLYNNEINIGSDPESGIQLLYNSEYFSLDSWLNWHHFMFKNNAEQESFTFCLSTLSKILNTDKLELYIPIQWVVRHYGGEIDTTPNMKTETYMNMDIGLGVKYKIDKKYIKSYGFDINYAIYNSNCNSTLKKGYGIFPRIFMENNDYRFNLGYWVSENFLPILGSAHFGNISTKIPDLIFNKMSMIYSSIEYTYKYHKNYSLGFDIEYYHYLPYSYNVSNIEYKNKIGKNSFSIGLYLRLNPRFKLLKVNLDS